MSKTFKSFDAYVAEASQPPFELPISEKKTLKIEQPNGAQVIEAQELAATGDIKGQLRCICGDAADDVLPLLLKAPAGVMTALVTDIMQHFGYDTGEAPASPLT